MKYWGFWRRTFLAPGDEAVMADHTFVIYKMEVTAAHGKVVGGSAEVNWSMTCLRWRGDHRGPDCCFSAIRTIRQAPWTQAEAVHRSWRGSRNR